MQQQQRNWGNQNDGSISYPNISNNIGYTNANVTTTNPMNQPQYQPQQYNTQTSNYPSQPQNLGFFSYGSQPKPQSRPQRPKYKPPPMKNSGMGMGSGMMPDYGQQKPQQKQNFGMFSYGQVPQKTDNSMDNTSSMDVPNETDVMGGKDDLVSKYANSTKSDDTTKTDEQMGMGTSNDHVMDLTSQKQPVKQMEKAIDYLSPYVVRTQTHKFEVMSGGRVLCCALNKEKMWCKTGAMIAYTGNASFSKKDIFDGLKMIGEAIIKQKMDLMKCYSKGNSQIFLSGDGKKIIPFFLKKDESIVIDRNNLLAFESSVRYNHSFSFGKLLQKGQLFACKVQGPGFVAITSTYDPIVIPIQKGVKIRTDNKNTLFWSGNLVPRIIFDVKLKTLLGAKSDEEFQLDWSSNKKQGYVGICPCDKIKEKKIETELIKK